LNSLLLILPRATEALAVKDESGVRVETIQDGYDLKAEYAAQALQPLGLSNITIGFFNAFGDEPVQLQDLLTRSLERIRQSFRLKIKQAIYSSQSLLQNHEKEQVQEVLLAASHMMNTWIIQNKKVPTLPGHVQDSLISQIHIAHASTIHATIRREGEWPYLSYSHHLGYGARRLAVLALQPLVVKFRAVTELMEAEPEYTEAKDLIQQAQRVLESAFEELLRKAQIMGQTAFKEALKLDPSIWQNCESEWGQGSGYRDRITDHNKDWFNAESRRALEHELWAIVTREWDIALKRLAALLGAEPDETEKDIGKA
jgi:hypothetical protein